MSCRTGPRSTAVELTFASRLLRLRRPRPRLRASRDALRLGERHRPGRRRDPQRAARRARPSPATPRRRGRVARAGLRRPRRRRPALPGLQRRREDGPARPAQPHVWTFLDFVEHVQPRAFVMENVKALAVSPRWDASPPGPSSARRGDGVRDEPPRAPRLRPRRPAAAGAHVPDRRSRRERHLDMISSTRPGRDHRARGARALPGVRRAGNDTFCAARVTPAKRPVMRRCLPWKPALQRQRPAPAARRRGAHAARRRWAATRRRSSTSARSRPARSPGSPGTTDGCSKAEAAQARARAHPAHHRRGGCRSPDLPAGMEWHGTRLARFRQIGNAVPPLLTRHVADAVARSLDATTASSPLAAVGYVEGRCRHLTARPTDSLSAAGLADARVSIQGHGRRR